MSSNGIFTVHPRSPNFRLAAYSTAENVYKPIAIHLGSSTGELPKPNSDPPTISWCQFWCRLGRNYCAGWDSSVQEGLSFPGPRILTANRAVHRKARGRGVCPVVVCSKTKAVVISASWNRSVIAQVVDRYRRPALRVASIPQT